MQEEVECLDQNVPVFPENTQKNISPHVSKERHINNMEHKYKNKSKLTLPLNKIHQKTFYILPLSKKISSPHKQNKQDSHILSISPPFYHVLIKTIKTKSKQKTYATKVKRKYRIKETNESSSTKNRGNSPYEEQQLPLRTTKVKKKNFSPPIKIGKTKHVLEKIVLGKILEVEEKYTNQT